MIKWINAHDSAPHDSNNNNNNINNIITLRITTRIIYATRFAEQREHYRRPIPPHLSLAVVSIIILRYII